jgi:hypothetical protein
VADHTSGQPAGWPAQYPPVQPSQMGVRYRVQTGFNPSIRAATADRERTVDVLKAGFAEGRLTQDEYNERMERAYEARTYGDLAELTADLPAGPMPPLLAQYPVVASDRPSGTNSMAVASILLGLATPVFGLTAIPAVITGHRARQEIRRTGEHGEGLAIAGLVLGYLAIFIGTIMLVGLMAYSHAHGSFPAGPGGPPNP